MKKHYEEIVREACICGAITLVIYEVYDIIRAKIEEIEDKAWHKAWDIGYKSGYNTGRFDGLIKAVSNKYITREEFDELIEED